MTINRFKIYLKISIAVSKNTETFFEDIVQAYYELLVSVPETSIIRVLRFFDIPTKNPRYIDVLGYQNLFLSAQIIFFKWEDHLKQLK